MKSFAKNINRAELQYINVGSKQVRDRLIAVLLAICMMQVPESLAAPDEIEVYTDDINAPGEFAVESHINYAITGTQTPAYPGQLPSNHVLQIMPEFSYGLTQTLEAGLYAPFAFAPDGNSYFNDFRVRLKYIAPRQSEEKMFYGVNVEAGAASLRTSQSASVMEIKPIIGYRAEQWLVSFNPNLSIALSNNVSNQPQFAPALKWAHSVNAGLQAGLEYYGEYGALNNLLPESQLSHTVYAVADVTTQTLDANFGIGHGYVNASDTWVAKAIIGFPFK